MIRKKQIPPPTKFGRNLRKLRTFLGIGQAALAQQLGLSRQKIASYEAGFVEPNARVFLSVCAFFRIDPASMLDEEIIPAHIPKVTKTRYGHVSREGIPEEAIPVTAIEYLRARTEDFEKILEGYELFDSLKEKNPGPEEEKALAILHSDLLSIMRMILKTNHAFMDFTSRKP